MAETVNCDRPENNVTSVRQQLEYFVCEWCIAIVVAARSRRWVCRRSLAGVAGLNPARGMDVYFQSCMLSAVAFG